MKVGGEGQGGQYGQHAEEITELGSLCFYFHGAQRSLHNRPLR
jgi:hypothetical protein